MTLPDIPVVEVQDLKGVTIPDDSGVGKMEAEKLQEIDN